MDVGEGKGKGMEGRICPLNVESWIRQCGYLRNSSKIKILQIRHKTSKIKK